MKVSPLNKGGDTFLFCFLKKCIIYKISKKRQDLHNRLRYNIEKG